MNGHCPVGGKRVTPKLQGPSENILSNFHHHWQNIIFSLVSKYFQIVPTIVSKFKSVGTFCFFNYEWMCEHLITNKQSGWSSYSFHFFSIVVLENVKKYHYIQYEKKWRASETIDYEQAKRVKFLSINKFSIMMLENSKTYQIQS